MDLELQIKEEPVWLQETANVSLVTTRKKPDNRTPGTSYETNPDKLRVYMEAITQIVAAKVEHADPALPALMVYHREGMDRVKEACAIFNHLGNFTKHGGQDPIDLTEAILPRAFIIRPQNQSWFRCYERSLSRDFQVIRLPGIGTRPEDCNKQEAATQTLQKEKATSTTATQTPRRRRHKKVGTGLCHPAATEPMTGGDRTIQVVLPKAASQDHQPPVQEAQECAIAQAYLRMADGSSEVEVEAPWHHSMTDTKASQSDRASFTMQTSGRALQDKESAQVPTSIDPTYQEEEAGPVAGHPLPLQSQGWDYGRHHDEPCADVKEEVDIKVPAVDELVPCIKEEDNVKNTATLTEDPVHKGNVLCNPLLTCSEDRRYCCPACNSMFALKGSLKTHMLTHCGLKPHCCSVCNRIFTTNSKLKNHMLIHSGERPFSCALCNAKFASKGILKGHILSHSPVKQHLCVVCKKTLAHKSALKTHMLTHFGDWPYSCSLCTSRFAFECQLRNHLLTHSGIRPHSCTICNKMFTQKGQLTKHMLTHSVN